MNKGVEIILERLKTNPEDFSTYLGAWGNLLSQALEGDFITKEEKELLNSTMIESKREKFTEKVVKHLLGDEMSAEGKSSVEAMLQNAIQLGNEVLDENVLRKIKRKLGI